MIYCLELKLFSIIKIFLGFNTEGISILIQKLKMSITFHINRTAVTFSYFIFSVIIVIGYIVTAEIIKSTSTFRESFRTRSFIAMSSFYYVRFTRIKTNLLTVRFKSKRLKNVILHINWLMTTCSREMMKKISLRAQVVNESILPIIFKEEAMFDFSSSFIRLDAALYLFQIPWTIILSMVIYVDQRYKYFTSIYRIIYR